MLPQRPASAVDCVSPAIEWTKRSLFRPFTWSKWWRIGLVGLLAGELSTANCSGGNFNPGRAGSGSPSGIPGLDPSVLWAIIGVLVIGGVALVLVHLYLMSVSRFLLFDAVTTGRYRIREGWARWHDRGLRWFGFNLVFILCMCVLFLIILLPFLGGIIAAKKAGAGAMIGAVLIAVPLFLLLALVAAVFYVLAKDFAVPIVALENEGVFSAFGRVLTMVRTRFGQFAGYIGIKIVLTIAYSIAFTIAIIVLMIPVVIIILAVAAAVGVTTPNIAQHPALLAWIITIGLVGVFLLLLVLALAFTPAIFFFQAYVYTWFAQRYEPLWNLLYPAPPQPPPAPAAEPISPSEPPPLPAF
jgi:hypothetical protein